jgi:hypothetical protein
MLSSEMTVVLVEQDPACAALIADGIRDAEREPLSPRIKLFRKNTLGQGLIEAEGSADVLLVDVAVLKDEEAADALLHTLQALPVILFSARESPPITACGRCGTELPTIWTAVG